MHYELLHNQWFGKAIGFVGAFVFAPDNHLVLSILVIFGVAVGHAFDWWAQNNAVKPKFAIPRSVRNSVSQSAQASEDPATHLKFLFAGMGHVAKTTGTVDRIHIRYTEALMRNLALKEKARASAIGWFNAGKSLSYDFNPASRNLRSAAENLRLFMTRCLCDTAALKPADAALDAVVKLAALLGIPASTVAKEFGQALERNNTRNTTSSHYRKNPRGQSSSKPADKKTPANSELSRAFKDLGVNSRASSAEVKKAYRRLVSKHHPDKLAPDASRRQHDEAQKMVIRLREALELIEASR